jgi:hypothetical protein
MNALHIPTLIKPLAPFCPDGANAVLELARDLSQRVVIDMAHDLLTRYQEQPIVGYALLYAAARHQGDTYEQPYGTVPYLYHLLDVAWCLGFTLEITDGLAVACGLLHDLLEDEKAAPAELGSYLRSLPEATPEMENKILAILHALIRPTGETEHQAYYAGLAQTPAEARLVKAADLICNTASLKAHARNWFSVPPTGNPRPYLIPKYVIEAEKYVLEQPAFKSLEGYSLIHNTLLGILQDLLNYLDKEAPAQYGLLDQLSLKRYRVGFRSSAVRIKHMHLN